MALKFFGGKYRLFKEKITRAFRRELLDAIYKLSTMDTIMLKFLKKTMLCCLALFSISLCFAEEGVVGKDAPANFSWSAPSDNEMGFKLISLDSERRKLYVQKGDFFAQVEMRPRSLSQLYSTAKGDKITFYTRQELEKPKEGYAMYVPVISVDTNSSSDVFLAFYKKRSGEMLAACVDVSLEAMPIPSLSIINFSPYRIGAQLGRRHYALNVFQSRTLPLSSSGERSSCVGTVKFFSLKNAQKPSFIEQKSYTFWSYERVIVVVFNQKEAATTPMFSAFNPAKRENKGGASTSSEVLVITNKGPR